MPQIVELHESDDTDIGYLQNENDGDRTSSLTTVNYSIYFRPLVENDRNEIKKFHEELFPVDYADHFYNTVVKNVGMDEQPLFACVAIAREEDEENSFQETINYDAWDENLASHIGVQLNTEDIRYRWKIKESTSFNAMSSSCSQVLQGESIVGCVVGTFMDTSCVPEDVVETLVWNPKVHSKMFYIMTLGSSKSFRGRGLGTKLIQDCIDLVEQVNCCGVIYLHVITYNSTAIRFYERLGFYRIQRIIGYYTIEGEKYDCFLYAKFMNGKTNIFCVMYIV